MDKFGLSDLEKQTNLHSYNHALFRNMMVFLDIVWEINILTKTVVILEDKNNMDRNNKEVLFEDIFHEYMGRFTDENDKNTFENFMSYERLIQMKEQVSFDLHLLNGDSEWELHNIVLTPAFDENNNLYCVYLGARNLQAEVCRELEEYHRQEQFLKLLLNNSYFYFSFDLSGDCVIYEENVKQDKKQMLKLLTQSELPVTYSDFIEKWFGVCEPQFNKECGMQDFSEEHLVQLYNNNERLLEYEVKQKSIDVSEVANIMQVFVVLMKQPQDKHIRVHLIWLDIGMFQKKTIRDNAELKNYNESLRKTLSQEQQYRLASLSGALLIYNINLTRNMIEEEFYEIVDERRIPMLKLVGLNPPCNFDEFCKRWCESKVSSESRDTFLKMFNREYMLKMYEQGERHLEIEFDTVLGRDIRVTLRNTAFLVEDTESGDIIAMVNSKDVSRQRAEEKRQRETLRDAYDAANNANSAKTDFLARMSHDIRTPMNAIIGMTAIARKHLGDCGRVEECLKEISTSGKYLLAILSEVLDMSKIESGKMELQKNKFDLYDVVDNILTICRSQCKEKKHDFAINVLKVEHREVVGDSQRLQQALMNLIDNAIKYTPNGGRIRLGITEKVTNRPNVGCYEFVVEDNGIGMEEEYLDYLFEPFRRSQDRRVAKVQGTGLGMPIAKNIIQMMNGSIDVRSKLNEGTTIIVNVFLKLHKEGEDGMYDETESYELDILKDKSYYGKRVLLVEDIQSNAVITKEILKMMGFEADHVWNGREAVDKISETDDGYYDIVFMDIQMPEMDGYAATQAIRSMEREYTKNIPIIALSANAFAEDVRQSLDCGMNAHIAKPINIAQLTKNLAKFL